MDKTIRETCNLQLDSLHATLMRFVELRPLIDNDHHNYPCRRMLIEIPTYNSFTPYSSFNHHQIRSSDEKIKTDIQAPRTRKPNDIPRHCDEKINSSAPQTAPQLSQTINSIMLEK